MMVSQHPRRRRHDSATRACALSAAILLLISVYLLYSRLLTTHSLSNPLPLSNPPPDPLVADDDPLLTATTTRTSQDRIDETDTEIEQEEEDKDDDDDEGGGVDDVDEEDRSVVAKYRFDHVSGVVRRMFDRRSIDQWDDDYDGFGREKEEPRDDRIGEADTEIGQEGEDDDDEEEREDEGGDVEDKSVVPRFRFDHVSGVIRRMFDRRSIDQWDDDYDGFGRENDEPGVVFGSDDVAVDEDVRRKVVSVRNVEDALLLKGSGLREGWGPWFEAKSDFLRRDRMFRSNLEGLNPLNNPLLQDPDGAGLTGLTKGDKVVMKGLLQEFKKVPFLVEKPLGVDEETSSSEVTSMKKPLVVKRSEKGVEDLTTKRRGIASMKKLTVVKSSEIGVEDLLKNAEIANNKKPLLVKRSENDAESSSGKGRETLVIKDSFHELESETEIESKVVDGGLESVKTEEMSTMKKPLVIKDSANGLRSISTPNSEVIRDSEKEIINVQNGDANVMSKPLESRALHEKASSLSSRTISKHSAEYVSSVNVVKSSEQKNVKTNSKTKQAKEVYANGKRWGYFPSLHPRLSFSKFMDAFFRKGKCSMRVFMIWNSPPWAFTVRHQRGLESLLFHHRNACLVVFSETIELNFFERFVKEGFKVAVAMPNLDELLKDTPTSVFSSVWFEWRKTTYYATHYSELIRLAALYKYGGVYLDSDVIVLRPLSSFSNSVGLVDPQAGSSLNGAVMSFRKHSPFIMECLTEFYSTYDDTKLRWNGEDLLTRVANNFTKNMDVIDDLKLQHSSAFFPIRRDNITRYFSAPETETERAEENRLFRKILKESFTFHFWNSLTLALVPEPESLVTKILNYHCLRCDDVL